MADSFADFVSEQLAALPEFRRRPMFGGFGLYTGTHFFGIISGQELYFKVNEQTRKDFEKLGSQPFAPSAKQVLKNYYQVPAEIIEDRPTLLAWAKKSD